MGKLVRAAVMLAPLKMRTRSFPEPRVDENSALVTMLASGVCGTDKHMYTGGRNLALPGAVIRFPVIPGHENLAVIDKIGDKAAEQMTTEGPPVGSGERVIVSADIICGRCYYCRNIYGYPWCENHLSYGDVMSSDKPPHLFGGWAEKMYLLQGTFIFRVPKRLTDREAVLAEQMAVAYGAFARAAQSPNQKEGYSPSDTVVIYGVGPLGLCNAFIAKMLGASKVIGIDVSDYRLRLAKRLCLDGTISAQDFPDSGARARAVRDLTDGLGADVVVECTGDPATLSEGLDMLRIGGTYLAEGSFVEGKKSEISVARQVVAKNARILGVAGMPYQAYGRVLKMMESHRNSLKFGDAVTHVFGIDQAESALKKSMDLDSMKVVVAPSGTHTT